MVMAVLTTGWDTVILHQFGGSGYLTTIPYILLLQAGKPCLTGRKLFLIMRRPSGFLNFFEGSMKIIIFPPAQCRATDLSAAIWPHKLPALITLPILNDISRKGLNMISCRCRCRMIIKARYIPVET